VVVVVLSVDAAGVSVSVAVVVVAVSAVVAGVSAAGASVVAAVVVLSVDAAGVSVAVVVAVLSAGAVVVVSVVVVSVVAVVSAAGFEAVSDFCSDSSQAVSRNPATRRLAPRVPAERKNAFKLLIVSSSFPRRRAAGACTRAPTASPFAAAAH
jgi:hypothetical protein